MSIDSSVNDVLAGGSAAFKFENVGDTCKGKITSGKSVQQTDIETGEPKTFKNGQPMMQLVVTVEQEDGEEAAIYFKGGKYEVADGEGKSSLDALRDALGEHQLEVGGTLAVQYSGHGKKKNPAYSAPKLYTVAYKPPVQAIDTTTGLLD